MDRKTNPKKDRSAGGLAPRALLLAAAYLVAALAVYAPSFAGPFVSDDLHYVSQNPYVQRFDAESLAAIWDPRSAVARMVENYAPVHLTLHGLAWRAFSDHPLGHHVTNVVVHTLACLSFAALLARRGLSPWVAAFGGAFLLLHPANVEAVAWISQLKSSSALLLSLLALLAFPRRAALATLLFALALFAKPTAAYAWPVAAWWLWTEPAEAGDAGARRRAWLGLGAFGLVFVLFAVAELAAFEHAAGHLKPLHDDPWVRARTVCAIAMRYLVLAATGLGASAFHEPPPALSALDPWWLASLPALGLVAARSVVTLRARRAELGFWLWAGVSFAPISQVFPFLFPMADRYLYFILPGLVGGALLAARDLTSFAAARGVRATAVVLSAALLVSFALRSSERARIWSSPALLVADAAKHYPGGISARQLEARRLAQQGDTAGAVAALRAAHARGYNRFEALLIDPGYAPLRGSPEFQSLVADMAAFWIERLQALRTPSQTELHFLAQAHVARGETAQAIEALERAAALPGPAAEAVQRDLAALRSRRGADR